MKKLFILFAAVGISLTTMAVPQQAQSDLIDGLYYETSYDLFRSILLKNRAVNGKTHLPIPYKNMATITVPSTIKYSIEDTGGNEEIYDIPVKIIGEDAFYNVTDCNTLIFANPSHVETIEVRGMAEMAGLSGTFTLPSSLKLIKEKGIYSGDNGGKMPITKLIIPAGIDSLGMSSVVLNQVTEIEFLGTTPPKIYNEGGVLPWTISSSSEYNTPKSITITVPAGAWDTYKNKAGIGDYFTCFGEATTKYTVKFMNGDTQLQSDELESGVQPVYSGAAPTKTQDAQFTYTFDGWISSADGQKYTTGNFPVVGTSDVTYTAHFNETVRSYTITFKNGSTQLQSTSVNYGVVPVYNGAAPTKEQTAQYTYTFKGWKSSLDNQTYIVLPAVTGETTYTAQFDNTLRLYTVTFLSEDGKQTLQTGQLECGQNPVYNEATPSKEQTVSETYTFQGWTCSADGQTYTGELPFVEGDVTFTAKFQTSVRNYQVVILASENGTITVVDGMDYQRYSGSEGTTLNLPYNTTLTVSFTPDANYEFDSWTNDGAENITVDGSKATTTIGVTFKAIATGLNENQYEIQSTKVIRNGALFIIRDGVMYDARGMRAE